MKLIRSLWTGLKDGGVLLCSEVHSRLPPSTSKGEQSFRTASIAPRDAKKTPPPLADSAVYVSIEIVVAPVGSETSTSTGNVPHGGGDENQGCGCELGARSGTTSQALAWGLLALVGLRRRRD